jgi:AcrR family transcriptional regulator
LSSEKIESHPAKPLLYSSAKIHERRKRLLKETRRLISEKGLEGFNVRELCRRADVAQRTLYNAFHDKDRLVGLAIREVYDEIREKLRHKTEPNSLEGILDRAIALNQRNLRSRNFARAMAAIYFSPNTPPDLWQVLQDVAVRSLRVWLTEMRATNQLHDWVIIDEIICDMANTEYGTINDWCAARMSDEDYIRRLVEGFLNLAIGVTKGPAHDRALGYMRKLRTTGRLPTFPASTKREPSRVAAQTAAKG